MNLIVPRGGGGGGGGGARGLEPPYLVKATSQRFIQF